MKKKWWIFIIVIAIIITIWLVIPKQNKNQKEDNKFKIVTSFYPMYIMTANITNGVQNIEITNLTQNNVGCVHDYTLVATDMKKLENANVFIQNGLNLENFTQKITQYYQDLKIIDTSINITKKIQEGENVNPHIWTSFENYTKQIEVIAQNLSKYNPENEQTYMTNYQNYLNAVTQLKTTYETELQNLQGIKIICLNEALCYLAEELQMEVTQIDTNHEESALSAENIKSIIEKMKKEDIKTILIGAEDDKKNAQTLANETGSKIYELETGLIGELEKNAYINSMTNNLKILKQIGK